MQTIIRALSDIRLPPLAAEALLGDAVAECLKTHGIGYERERIIGPGCRADFLCGDIVLELKLAAKKPVATQILRYLQCECVEGLILVAERTVSLATAAKASGKPVVCFSVRRAWGVAV